MYVPQKNHSLEEVVSGSTGGGSARWVGASRALRGSRALGGSREHSNGTTIVTQSPEKEDGKKPAKAPYFFI